MDLIRSFKEVSDCFEKIKKLNDRFITNFFLNEAKICQWIENGDLSSIEEKNSIFIFRRHMDFYYLNYIAVDEPSLFLAIKNLPVSMNTDYVADVVDKGEELNQTSKGLMAHGFILHEILKRMVMTKNKPVDKNILSSEVEFAKPANASAIFEFLVQRLDKYSEQIPDIREIEAAIVKRNLLICEKNKEIAGLLYFEKNGFTSHLKEWLVNEKYRDNKIGSKLINMYFYLCNDCKRFILWVKQNNEDAIRKYVHYGYMMDGLKDTILVKHK